MKASETTFQPVIEGTKQYVVPLFQRPYSWSKKEWEVLWTDLLWLYENEEPKSHFIGSFVTMPTTSVPEGVAKYLLIDGQQRLTTIFIILALLRDLARRLDKNELAQEIQETMLVNRFKKDDDHFKLMPTQADREHYKRLVLEQVNGDDNQLHSCYQFFARKVTQSGVDLASLNKVIAGRLSAVSIVLDPDDNPHLVFESLNAKGRSLTQSDLIRNYFFMRIHVSEQEFHHAQHWSPMQTALGDDLTEFIRHYLMRQGTFVKQGDVYFTIKDRIGQGDAVEALKELATFAQYYKKLLDPEFESSQAIRVLLESVMHFD